MLFMKGSELKNALRGFLAVDISTEVRAQLRQLQRELRPIFPVINWVRPESVHLTLKFLGYLEESLVHRLYSSLQGVGKDFRPFTLGLKGLGVFPHAKRPRILWVGCEGNLHVLHDLVLHLEILLESLGFPPDNKPFHAHFTLARIKHEQESVGRILQESGTLDRNPNLGTIWVDRFSLFQSVLGPAGAQYTPLWTVPLQEENGDESSGVNHLPD